MERKNSKKKNSKPTGSVVRQTSKSRVPESDDAISIRMIDIEFLDENALRREKEEEEFTGNDITEADLYNPSGKILSRDPSPSCRAGPSTPKSLSRGKSKNDELPDDLTPQDEIAPTTTGGEGDDEEDLAGSSNRPHQYRHRRKEGPSPNKRLSSPAMEKITRKSSGSSSPKKTEVKSKSQRKSHRLSSSAARKNDGDADEEELLIPDSRKKPPKPSKK